MKTSTIRAPADNDTEYRNFTEKSTILNIFMPLCPAER